MRQIINHLGIVLTLMLAFGMKGFAQDTIRFIWETEAMQNLFFIDATNGEPFTVDWGDGNTKQVTGKGSNTHIEVSHEYAVAGNYSVMITTDNMDCRFEFLVCFFQQLTSIDARGSTALTDIACQGNIMTNIDVSTCTKLRRLNCSNNQLIRLDVCNNTDLINLYCYNNALTSLDVSTNLSLDYLDCRNNHLPLSDLYVASEILESNNANIDNRRLGSQTLLPKTVPLGIALFSDQSEFGGEYTKYEVKQDGISANPSDYTVIDGKITFHTLGVYSVTMSNDAIISSASYPAEVSVELTIREANTDASLLILTVSDRELTPVFNPTVYEYTVCLEDAVRSIYITAVPNDSNATVNGDGQQQLGADTNLIIITVIAEDDTTTQEYKITVINGSNVGIVGANGIRPEIRVYPNPATGQLTVECRDVINHVSTVEIYDVVGQSVGAGLKPAPTNAKNEIVIDISHLAAGMYFLKIDNKTIKFVKE